MSFQAVEKDRERRLEARQENNSIRNHILHTINSTLLTEDERVAKSALGPNRVLCDRYDSLSFDPILHPSLYRDKNMICHLSSFFISDGKE